MKNYFAYLPEQPVNSIWGCVATAVGFTNIQPNTPYPPRQHPLDHYFDWNEGRVLQSFQIILISAGTGIFESAAQAGQHRVGPGTVMVLFPGIWHRYRPDAGTGWVEHWIECHGPVFEAAGRVGIIQPKDGLIHGSLSPDLSDSFERCHSLARLDAMANQDLLSTLGLHLLALLGHMRRGERGFTKAIDDVVQRAHTLIALRCHERLDLPALAAELGVGYSNLRHNFLARVGVSPRQHYLNTRMQKTQDLLVNTPKSVKEIAEVMGFESAAYLSRQFKQRLGVAPNDWRKKFAGQRRNNLAGPGQGSTNRKNTLTT
jgi:AraC-like DNA-binding protein